MFSKLKFTKHDRTDDVIGYEKKKIAQIFHSSERNSSSKVRLLFGPEGVWVHRGAPRTQGSNEPLDPESGGDSPIKMRVGSSYLLGVKFVDWYRLGCNNIKQLPVKLSRYLSGYRANNDGNYVRLCWFLFVILFLFFVFGVLELVSQEELLVPLRGEN